jgi:hypothetical protein
MPVPSRLCWSVSTPSACRAHWILKTRLIGAKRLDNDDIQFLQRVFDEASSAQRLAAEHAEFQELVGRLISLYSEITSKGLENEKKA